MESLNAETISTLVTFKEKARFKMSDTSRPQGIEGLESRVGAMKAELSHIRAQTEQTMGMMQQLL